MRIAVYGAGGVGGYFGGRLARAGERVVFLARGAHLAALRARGLAVESTLGDFAVNPVEATDEPAQVGPVDVVLVAVKAWQVREVAPKVRALLGPETFVVPLENGVEALELLADAVGAERVLGGTCRILAHVAAPGRVAHTGAVPSVTFGELAGRGASARAEKLRAAFERAGVAVDVPDDVRAALWTKFVFITAFGGVGAVTRAPAGVLRAQPGTRALLEQAAREAWAVARGLGVALDERVVAGALAAVDALPFEAMASMPRELIAGRPSELLDWNGAIVRLGERAGVATPLHRFVVDSLGPTELRNRGELAFEAP